MPINLVDAVPQSPEWWLRRLLARLEAVRPEMDLWDAYYDGRQTLRFFDDAVRDEFGQVFRRFCSNYTSLVVDAFTERLRVTGFRFKDDRADQDLWDIWQANDLDGQSQMAHTEALIKRRCYALVEPPAANDSVPRITLEDPLDCIVETDPRDRRKRLAGLKRFIDDSGHLEVWVYLPDRIHRFRTKEKWPDSYEMWSPTAGPWTSTTVNLAGGFDVVLTEEGDSSIVNPIGVVPLVPIVNRPRLRASDRAALNDGRSEVAAITSNQDLVNWYRVLSVIAAGKVAIPQRWATNLEVETDKDTGQPKPPFRGGFAKLWVVEPIPGDDPRASQAAAQTEFGQFPPSDVTVYDRLMASEVRGMADIAGLPYYYLTEGTQQSFAAPSGESIKSSDARMVKKVGHMQTSFGEGWEETMRVALRAMKDERYQLRTAETLWGKSEVVNQAVVTDAIVKLHTEGLIDDETALEELDFSPQTITRLIKAKEKRDREAAAAIANGDVPPPDGSGPPAPGPTNGVGPMLAGGSSRAS